MITPNFSIKMAEQAFDVCNSDIANQGQNAGKKMVYPEFAHGLISVALIKNSNIFVPLTHRIETFLDQLITAAK